MLKTAAATAIALAVGIASAALAHDYKLGSLQIGHPFARATPGMAKNGAAYLTVENRGETADRLVAVRGEVAKRIELHTHRQEGGVMRMRPIEGGIAIPPGGKAALAPGGEHVMLMGLGAPLREGESFPLTLVFEQAGEITVEVRIEGIAAGASGHHGGTHR